jgi:hypothetical protein
VKRYVFGLSLLAVLCFAAPVSAQQEPSSFLLECAASASDPTYTAGTVNPCSMTTGGGIRMFGRVVLVDTGDTPIIFPADATHGQPTVANGMQLMAECDNVSTGAATEGAAVKVLVDCTTRGLRTQAVGNTSFRDISGGLADDDESVVMSAAGVLLGISARNTHATAGAHLKCTNTATLASNTPGSTTIVYEMFIPAIANGGTVVDRGINMTLSTGLVCYLATGDADSDTTDVVAGDVSYNVTYTLR